MALLAGLLLLVFFSFSPSCGSCPSNESVRSICICDMRTRPVQSSATLQHVMHVYIKLNVKVKSVGSHNHTPSKRQSMPANRSNGPTSSPGQGPDDMQPTAGRVTLHQVIPNGIRYQAVIGIVLYLQKSCLRSGYRMPAQNASEATKER